ncbi:MAG: hypothetical protein VW891_16415, partial [Novosphingobium sp.]
SYISPSGKIWDSSGIYTDTIINNNGCDSIITLNLTISNPTNYADTNIACDSFRWNNNGVTYFESIENVFDTLVASSGCDSIIELILLINRTSTLNDTIEYSVIDSNYDNNSPVIVFNKIDTLIASTGCDSIVSQYLKFKYYTGNSCSDTIEVTVFDTVAVMDTTVTELFDTTITQLYDVDTIVTEVFDTVDVKDTIVTELFDTTTTQLYDVDTIVTEVFDTVAVK